MINIFNNLWLNSIPGLIIILAITIINIILSRRKTLVVCILDQSFFSIMAIVLFGFPCIIYSFICLTFMLFKKYWDRYRSDNSYLNYNEKIHSVSRFKNLREMNKGDDIIVGNVVPTNHKTVCNNMKPIKVTETILSGGMLLTGSTGSGKTSTMSSLIKQAAEKGKPVTFFDFKGETDILDDLEEYCNKLNIPYYEFSTRRCTFSYDPLKELNETGKVEAILNTRRWSADGADEHYKTSMQLAIQGLVKAYDKYRNDNNDTSNYILGLYKFCGQYKPQLNEKDGYNTVIKMLEILLSSKARELFNNQGNEFTFQRNDCYVICFSFVSANKALANSLSSFIFQDIMDRGTRRQYNPKMLLCVDEFGTLENSAIIKDILEKGRSGGIQTVFSILDINQIAMTTSMYFVNAILGTINSYVFHAGSTQQTAELLSGVQKYQLDFDIMSLQKPYNGKPPTALFISKYPILNKNGSQESYKIIPYNYKSNGKEFTEKVHYSDNAVFTSNENNDIINMNIEQKESMVEPTKEMFDKPVDVREIDKYF